MKKIIYLLVIAFTLPVTVIAQDLSAKQIIQKVDAKMRGNSSKGVMSMTIERPKWSRTVKMKMWSLNTKYSMIYISEPVKEKGMVFLKRENEMWNWVPNIQRLIKLPPSMMMQSWMGSDFTNDDLVKQSSIVVDYEHKTLGKETIRGSECYKLELIAKEDAPVVWGKVLTWISVKGYNQIKAEYYDEDDFLVHTENGYDLKKMDDRVMATRIEIVPEDKPGNKTILKFLEMDFDIEISESFFSQQNMKRIK